MWDESALTAPDPAVLAQVLADANARQAAALRPGDVVVGLRHGGDDARCWANPGTGKTPACWMALQRPDASGAHTVHSGTGEQRHLSRSTENSGRWMRLSDAYLTARFGDGAGGYGIQAARPNSVRGIWAATNVVGLPVSQVHRVLCGVWPGWQARFDESD